MRLFLLTVVLVMVSCVSSKFLPGGTISYTPYNGVVEILYEVPKNEYEIIGIVIVRGEDASLAHVFEELRVKTAEVGGNAVIVQQSQNLSINNCFLMGSSEIKEVVGTAVKINIKAENQSLSSKK